MGHEEKKQLTEDAATAIMFHIQLVKDLQGGSITYEQLFSVVEAGLEALRVQLARQAIHTEPSRN